MLEVPRQQPANVEGLQRPAHPSGCCLDRRCGDGQVGGAGLTAAELAQHLGAALGAGLDEEAMLSVEQLGQRQVVAGLDLRAGAHRRAEARVARLEAVHCDEDAPFRRAA